MKRWIFLFLLVPTVSWAAPESAAPGPAASCERSGAEALAKAKNVAVKDLDGINQSTTIRVRHSNGEIAELTIVQSSGNAALDEVAADCIRADKDVTGSGTVTHGLSWQHVMTASTSLVPPRSRGNPHICLTNYPAEAVREGRVGSVELAFDVTAGGTVDGIIIAASSGSADLDVASTRCAALWLYHPATENGVAVDVSWHAMVNWSVSGRSAAPAPSIKTPFTNCVRANAEAAQRVPGALGTTVRYRLTNGEVTAAGVGASSGDIVLDGLAVACIRVWRFDTNDAKRPSSGVYEAFIDWHQKTVR